VTLARLAKRANLNDPNVPITAANFYELFGAQRSKAGTLVSEDRVLGIPAYYRAMAIRSGVEAALPLKVYKRGSREPVRSRTPLDSPNPAQRPFGFRQTMKFNEFAWGNSFARKVRNGAGIVTQTWPVHPSRVRVKQVEITGRNPEGKEFVVLSKNGTEYTWTSWEMFHVPFMSPDGLSGVSALQAFRESLGTAIAAEDTAGTLYANGIRPSGLIKSKKKLNEESAARLKRQAQAKLAGPEHAGEIMVLDDDADWISMTIPPQDAQLLESRQWSVSEIARMVGVMPHMIGDTERSTSWGTGIEQQFIGWVQTIVYPSCKNFEELVTADLLPGGWDGGSWFAEHSFEGLLRGDSAARAAFYASAIQWGWMSRNEVRALDNLEPRDGLDELLTPSNMTLISIDGTPIPLGGGASAPSPA
jgi:HK97 family phage portal protein